MSEDLASPVRTKGVRGEGAKRFVHPDYMKSMTGYGTADGKIGRGRLYIEVKTINHRYCEVALKIPPRMGGLEAPIREYVQNALVRGRIEVFVREVQPLWGSAELVLDLELAKQYQQALKKLRAQLKIQGDVDPIALAGIDHFIRSKEPEGNYLSLWRPIYKLLQKAVKQVETMRLKEGNHLHKDQCARVKSLINHLEKIDRRAHSNSQTRKMEAVQGVANGITTDKMDITEELIRLKSHVKQYQDLLKSKGSTGRKLDFLIQEMHREINTVGSKAGDSEIAKSVVESKAILENLREQVQNLL